MNQTLKKFSNILEKAFSSFYFTPVIFAIAFVLYFAELTAVAVCLFAIAVVFILSFCKNIRNIFSLVFYMAFFINDIYNDPRWVVYVIAIGLACFSFLLFFIKNLILNKENLTKGKLFYPLIVADVAFLLGGVIGFFSLRVFIITFAFSFAAYLLYWLAINFTSGLKEHLFFMFVVGAFLIVIQTLILKIINTEGDFLDQIIWIGSQNINVASLFVLFGVVGCYGLGLQKKYDYALFLLAILLSIGIFIMHCRLVMFLTAIFTVLCALYTAIKSTNKILFVSVVFGVLLIVSIFYLSYKEQITEFIIKYLGKDFTTTGRRSLWTWCVEKFDENFLFGAGFVAENDIPGLAANPKRIILAHNTLIQWLVSLGLVGTILMMFFYLGKYKVLLEKVNKSTFFLIISVLVIETSGLMDQAATMDIFVYILSLVLIGAIEIEPKKDNDSLFCKDDLRIFKKKVENSSLENLQKD